MKHIQRIVAIALTLGKATGWNAETVYSFIETIADYEQRLRRYNELLMNGKDKTFERLRTDIQGRARDFLLGSELPLHSIEFRNDVRTPSILMKLKLNEGNGANFIDGESFVIDL